MIRSRRRPARGGRLLFRLVATLTRSIDRLETVADIAASDKAVAAPAAVSGTLYEAIEVAARLPGLNKSPDEIPGAPRATLSGSCAPATRPSVIEGTAAALPPADAED